MPPSPPDLLCTPVHALRPPGALGPCLKPRAHPPLTRFARSFPLRRARAGAHAYTTYTTTALHTHAHGGARVSYLRKTTHPGPSVGGERSLNVKGGTPGGGPEARAPWSTPGTPIRPYFPFLPSPALFGAECFAAPLHPPEYQRQAYLPFVPQGLRVAHLKMGLVGMCSRCSREPVCMRTPANGHKAPQRKCVCGSSRWPPRCVHPGDAPRDRTPGGDDDRGGPFAGGLGVLVALWCQEATAAGDGVVAGSWTVRDGRRRGAQRVFPSAKSARLQRVSGKGAPSLCEGTFARSTRRLT